ncbi:MAG TPA: hypothetical protein VGI75_03400, partial [Pirellulales bacterium]
DLTEDKKKREAVINRIDELVVAHAATADGESSRGDLKNEINDLCKRLGEEPRYPLEAGGNEAGE